MERLKTRDEIDDKYKWDVTKIYKNDEEWEEDYKKAWDLASKFENFRGNLFSSKENLIGFYKVDDEFSLYLNKLQSYAFLNYIVDMSSDNYSKMQQKISDLFQKVRNNTSYFEEEFFQTDYSKIEEILDSDDNLSGRKNYFERLNRKREHYLDSDTRKLLSDFSSVLNTGNEIYTILNNTEINFGTVTLEDSREIEISNANIISLLKNKDRELREKAFFKYYETYGGLSSTISAAYISDINSNKIINKFYNFNSNIEKALFYDDVSVDVYDSLIKEVNNGLPYLYDYYKFKKEALELDEFHMYDTYVDIIKDKPIKNYTYEEVLDLVVDGLSPLGSGYIKKVKDMIDSKMIDVMPNENKREGAFSYVNYDIEPYMLLNFNGTFDDAYIIAHEMGHAMHTYYSNTNNERDYADYSIFVAEIASTVNELLVMYNLLDKSDDPKEKLYIMNKLLDNYKATIYRQTMFAEFEKNIYNRCENGDSLTRDDICNYYYDLNKKYFGDSVFVDDEIKYEWEKITHFFRPFYVYKYATSMSASIVIANRIYNGDSEFRDRYLNFLKLGGSMMPLDEIKTLGIEMEDGKLFKESMESFDSLRKRFEKQYREVYDMKEEKVYKKK